MSSFLRNLKFPKILFSGGKERRGGENRERPWREGTKKPFSYPPIRFSALEYFKAVQTYSYAMRMLNPGILTPDW